jgi:hypothetical protein
MAPHDSFATPGPRSGDPLRSVRSIRPDRVFRGGIGGFRLECRMFPRGAVRAGVSGNSAGLMGPGGEWVGSGEWRVASGEWRVESFDATPGSSRSVCPCLRAARLAAGRGGWSRRERARGQTGKWKSANEAKRRFATNALKAMGWSKADDPGPGRTKPICPRRWDRPRGSHAVRPGHSSGVAIVPPQPRKSDESGHRRGSPRGLPTSHDPRRGWKNPR